MIPPTEQEWAYQLVRRFLADARAKRRQRRQAEAARADRRRRLATAMLLTCRG
jgi:hypothetical protein